MRAGACIPEKVRHRGRARRAQSKVGRQIVNPGERDHAVAGFERAEELPFDQKALVLAQLFHMLRVINALIEHGPCLAEAALRGRRRVGFVLVAGTLAREACVSDNSRAPVIVARAFVSDNSMAPAIARALRVYRHLRRRVCA